MKTFKVDVYATTATATYEIEAENAAEAWEMGRKRFTEKFLDLYDKAPTITYVEVNLIPDEQ